MTKNLFGNKWAIKMFSPSGNGMLFAAAVIMATVSFGAPGWAKDESKLKSAAAAKQSAAMKKGLAAALAYEPWVKNCSKAAKNKPSVCGTHADYFDSMRSVPYTRIAIQQIDGKEPKVVVNLVNSWLSRVKRIDPKTKKGKFVLAPTRARWIIPAGVFIKVDENKVYKLNYTFCMEFSCVATGKATKALLAEMSKGKKVVIVGINSGRKQLTIVSLKGFGKVYKGKATDKPYNATLLNELKGMVAKKKAYLKQRQEAAKKAGKK